MKPTLGEIRSISKPIGKPVRIFTVDSNLSVDILTAGGTGASLNILGGRGEIVDENVFESNRSLLSSSSVIQNNFNYQQFSYTIFSRKIIKTIRRYCEESFSSRRKYAAGTVRKRPQISTSLDSLQILPKMNWMKISLFCH